MAAEYQDRWITCDDDGLSIRFYYFPFGTKRIPYGAISGVQRVSLGSPVRGRGRLWGTSNPRYWASLDPRRMRKKVGLVLDVGGGVRPVITPDDPDAVAACIRRHAGDVVSADTVPGPFI